MLLFIALFIIPVLIMIFRHRLFNASYTGPIHLAEEYVIILLADSFCSLFLIRYIILRVAFDVNSFSSIQFFLKYCVVAVVVGVFIIFAEVYCKRYIPNDWQQVLKAQYRNIREIFDEKIETLKQSRFKIFFSDKGKAYYVRLGIISIMGALILMLRARLGVDITDDAWYTSDPYWVAKGSIPYVNNWTQASGFTLPLFVFHNLFLHITGGSEGIIMFSRILYCVWKPAVIFLSFVYFKKAKITIPPILALPIIVFNSGQLYSINYNTIGVTYSFLLFSIAALIISFDDNVPSQKKVFTGFICGIIMGRCIIGTPFTIVACFSILFLLLIKKCLVSAGGYFVGGVVSAGLVVSFCCIRGGIRYFIIGIQYFFRDIGYWNALDQHGVPFIESTQYLLGYFKPALFAVLTMMILRLIVTNQSVYNHFVILVSSILCVFAVYGFSRYSGTGASIAYATKYGWVIPVVCSFFCCENVVKNKLRLLNYFTVTIAITYILAGYVSAYGFDSRSYWNYIPTIIGLYVTYLCIQRGAFHSKVISRIGISLICAVSVFLIVRGNYLYVYRDASCEHLTTKVESGPWKGCITTPERENALIYVEQELKKKTDKDNQVLCWGVWACFMNLMCNGKLCSASPLGTSEINGFDYWHMYQVVPDKIFVNVDLDDRYEIMSDKRNVWAFISRFYYPNGEIMYESYDTYGEPVFYRIIEYDLSDGEGALSYADKMATPVFEP